MSAHQPWQGEDAPEECIVCEKPWPCADALDEARAEIEGWQNVAGSYLQERDAARADADALAEAGWAALRSYGASKYGIPDMAVMDALRLALAAHEAQKEGAG